MLQLRIDVTVKGVNEPLYKNVMARLAINLQKDNERLQPKSDQALASSGERGYSSRPWLPLAIIIRSLRAV